MIDREPERVHNQTVASHRQNIADAVKRRMEMAVIRRHYIFYGRVQGVGFRYRAYYAARENNVTGWVRNEYDGSVEMEAEGSPENIENMLLSVENSRYIRIEDFECKKIPVQNSRTFEIL